MYQWGCVQRLQRDVVLTGDTIAGRDEDVGAARPRTGRAGTPSRRRTASGALTGLAGLVAGVAASVLLRYWLEPVAVRGLVVAAAVGVAMLTVDLLVYRVDRNVTRELSDTPLRPLDPRRIAIKLVSFWLTLGMIAAAYALLPIYRDSFYAPFRLGGVLVLPALAVASPLYIAWVDRRQFEPDDAYVQLVRAVMCKPFDRGVLGVHVRGWLIKAFFIPLMFLYVCTYLDQNWSAPLLPPIDFDHVFGWLLGILYFIDVVLALAAYSLTLRIADSHVRSAEPTIGGFAICLACYPPFNSVLGTYTAYDQDGLDWTGAFAHIPWLYVCWGSVILVLVAIYAWSTAAFGLRFSNLTNRGIITSGPYRWLKHPAYVSKNVTWWMMSVPFVAGAGWQTAIQSCLMLAAVNGVYFLRARTEERHLSADPVYRDYAAFIAEHGLVAHLRRPSSALTERLKRQLDLARKADQVAARVAPRLVEDAQQMGAQRARTNAELG